MPTGTGTVKKSMDKGYGAFYFVSDEANEHSEEGKDWCVSSRVYSNKALWEPQRLACPKRYLTTGTGALRNIGTGSITPSLKSRVMHQSTVAKTTMSNTRDDK